MKKLFIISFATVFVACGGSKSVTPFQEYADKYNVKTVEDRLKNPATGLDIDKEYIAKKIDNAVDHMHHAYNTCGEDHCCILDYEDDILKKITEDYFGKHYEVYQTLIRQGDIIRIYYKYEGEDKYVLFGMNDKHPDVFNSDDTFRKSVCYTPTNVDSVKIVAYDECGREFHTRKIYLCGEECIKKSKKHYDI